MRQKLRICSLHEANVDILVRFVFLNTIPTETKYDEMEMFSNWEAYVGANESYFIFPPNLVLGYGREQLYSKKDTITMSIMNI